MTLFDQIYYIVFHIVCPNFVIYWFSMNYFYSSSIEVFFYMMVVFNYFFIFSSYIMLRSLVVAIYYHKKSARVNDIYRKRLIEKMLQNEVMIEE